MGGSRSRTPPSKSLKRAFLEPLHSFSGNALSSAVCTLPGRRGNVIMKKRAKEKDCVVICSLFTLAINTSAHTCNVLVFTSSTHMSKNRGKKVENKLKWMKPKHISWGLAYSEEKFCSNFYILAHLYPNRPKKPRKLHPLSPNVD